MDTETSHCPRCRRPLIPGARFCGECGSPASPLSPLSPLTPGTTTGGSAPALPDRYRVVKFLGRGGMGRVYLCHDTLLDVEVAVKVLPAELSHDEEALAQIAREARAAAKFRSCPGILSLYGIERHGETWYILMEYGAGGSLHDRLKKEGPLPEAECRALGAEVADALAFAEERGVLHRDIKPANVLLDDRGRAKVADFGIAKVMSEASSRMSMVTVAGTPIYMAPEIILQQAVDGRADLYSLGCMLFELSTGKRPFEGSYPEVAMMKTAPHARPPDPRSVRPDLSEEFAAVVRRLLEPDPRYRYPRGRDVVAALGGLPPRATGRLPADDDSGALPVPMARPLEPGAPEGGSSTLTSPPGREPTVVLPPREGGREVPPPAPVPPAPPAARGRTPLLVGGAILLLAVAGFLLRPGGEPAPAGSGSGEAAAPPAPDPVPPGPPPPSPSPGPVPQAPGEGGAPAVDPPAVPDPAPPRTDGRGGGGGEPERAAETPVLAPDPPPDPEPAPAPPPPAPPAPPPPPPGLLVFTDPPGARITVDGREAGVAGPGGLLVEGPAEPRTLALRAWLADHRPAEDRAVPWTPGERREVRLRLERQTGFLVLEGGPPGALVTCRREGAEPLRFSLSEDGSVGPFPVPVGEYAVSVKQEGFDPFEGAVTVVVDRTARRSVSLREKPGTLAVDSVPSGAEVYDGALLLGRTPLPPVELAPGTHALRLVHPERDELAREVEIRGGAPVDLGTLELPPLATLDLGEPVEGVAALVDGRPAAGVLQVRPGEVEVRFTRKDHEDQVVRVPLVSGAAARPRPGPWIPLAGWIDLSALPADVAVRVDGAAVERSAGAARVVPGARRVALLREGWEPVPEVVLEVAPGARVPLPPPAWVVRQVVAPAVPDLPPPPEATLAAQRAMALPPGVLRRADGRLFAAKDGAELVLVPAGEFVMGSEEKADEKPVHRPFLSAFLVDRHEVTNGQYWRFHEATKTPFPEMEGKPQKTHPVINVSWKDAAAYAAWAGRRLPTEAEWEKAARGTDGRAYPWGGADDPARRNGEGAGDGFDGTSPAGQFPGGASPFGALDMAGNAAEWVADGYDPGAYAAHGARDPKGPNIQILRVFRGGSWYGSAAFLRCAARNRSSPTGLSNNKGFRCAVDAEPAK